MASHSPSGSRIVAADDPTVANLMKSPGPRLAHLLVNLKYDVVRVLYLGNDIDGRLRAKGFSVQVVPCAVSLGNFLYDLVVAEEELDRFHTSLKPALTCDNEERDSNELFPQERFTDDDLLVQYHGKAQAIRKTLIEFKKHAEKCWDEVRHCLEGEIKSLQALHQSQGWGDILSPELHGILDPGYLAFHDVHVQYQPVSTLGEDSPAISKSATSHLEVPAPEGPRKRRSDDNLSEAIQERQDEVQESANFSARRRKITLSRGQGKEGWVQKPPRRRIVRQFCCACQDLREFKVHDLTCACKLCDHERCPECMSVGL